MAEFEITERTEPLTLDEVFSFIDDTNISKMDAHELKSRIADVVKAERNKAIDNVMKKAKELQEDQIKNLEKSTMRNGKRWAVYMTTYLGHIQVVCKRLIAEKLKGGAE